jgi:DNA-binding MarR family transcriptional regulator
MENAIPSAQDIYGACVCLRLSRAARGVTRRYDHALKPLGLTSGQFGILTALAAADGMPLGVLAGLLGMDRTTLNRNLKPLAAAGLVDALSDDKDRRVRGLRLTPPGHTRLSQAIPVWQAAQQDSNRRLGREGWPELRPLLDALA